MSRRVIVLGDLTSHDGKVISAAATDCVDGKPIARLGDEVSCPRHGDNKIVEGHGSYLIDGIPVALEGHRTECGAVLIGSVNKTVG